MNDLEMLRTALKQLAERIESLCAELEGMERLAMQLGAISLQIDAARDWARENDEVRSRIHKDYAEMWEAIEKLGTDALALDLLRNLPPNCKPN